QFAARRWLEIASDVDYLIVIEVQPWHGKLGTWLWRFFLQRTSLSLFVELHHTVTLRIFDLVCEDGRTTLPRGHIAQHRAEALSIEDIVPQDQRRGRVSYEICADQKGLRQSGRLRLFRISETHSP